MTTRKKIKKSYYQKAVTQLQSNGYQLFKPYQEEGVKWLLEKEKQKKGGLLCDEMGLGKTIQMISLILGSPLKKTLVILPASLINQWNTEIKKFAGKIIEVYVHHGNNRNFIDFINTDKKQIVITSYNLIINDNSKFNDFIWDRTILDECHYIRNRKSIIFQKINNIKSNIKWGISGTPIQNYVKDLENIFNYLGFNILDCKYNLESLVKNFILRRTKNEVKHYQQKLDIPEYTINNVNILIKNTKEKNLYLDLDSYDFTPLEAVLRKKQVAILPQLFLNGMDLKTKTKSPPWQFTNTKYNYMINYIQKNYFDDEHKIIIFTTFKYEIQYLIKKFNSKKIDCKYIDGSISMNERDEIINDKDNKILIIQIVCGGTGLNLQHYNIAFFTSPTWNPSLEDQAIARLHRIGQTKNVIIHRLLVHKTIDRYIDNIQKVKRLIIDKYIKSN